MIKNIIREVPAEQAELSFYFDSDTFRDYDGKHFNYNLFIIQNEGYNRIYGLNIDDYKATQERAESIIDGFNDVTDELTDYDGNPITFDMVLSDEGISTSKRDDLIKWYESDPDTNDAADIANFLSITTGESWNAISAHGYSQGDFCDIVYCESTYTEQHAYNAGEIWLGCAKEFCVIDLDENGEETNSCYGYIVTDCQIKSWTDADSEYKRIVCEWSGADPETTRIEMIDYNKPTITRTIYNYRTIDPEPVTISANLPKAAHTTSTKTY